MRIRRATEADEPVARELWEEFEAEVPEPPGFAPETWDEAWADIRRHIREGVALLAEDDEGPVGHAWAAASSPGHGTAGSPSTTSCATASRARSAGSEASSRTRPALLR